MMIKKRLMLLFFIVCAQSILLPTLYADPSIDQLHEQVQDEEGAILDLDDDDIISEDEDLLAILDESMDEPSLLWTWFQTVGSSLMAHCIHAQRYMRRIIDRMKLWLKVRKTKEQKKYAY